MERRNSPLNLTCAISFENLSRRLGDKIIASVALERLCYVMIRDSIPGGNPTTDLHASSIDHRTTLKPTSPRA